MKSVYPSIAIVMLAAAQPGFGAVNVGSNCLPSVARAMEQERSSSAALTNDDLEAERIDRAKAQRLQDDYERDSAEQKRLSELYERAGRALKNNLRRGIRPALRAAYSVIIREALVDRAEIRVKTLEVAFWTTAGTEQRFDFSTYVFRDPF